VELLFTVGLTFPDPYPHGITLTGRAPTPETRQPVRGEVVEIRGYNGERVRATVQAVAKGFRVASPGPLGYLDRAVVFSAHEVPRPSGIWGLSEVWSTAEQDGEPDAPADRPRE
jgi:hypothetical protein